MFIENDAYNDCEDLTCGDYKGHNMLFELFNHTVHEDLTERGQARKFEHIIAQLRVSTIELQGVGKLARDYSIEKGDDGDPLVDMLEHLHRTGLVLGLDYCLEIGQEPICNKGDSEKHNA